MRGIAPIRHILARSEQLQEGPQGPPVLNPLGGQNVRQALPPNHSPAVRHNSPVVPAIVPAQPWITPFQAAYRLANANAGPQSEVVNKPVGLRHHLVRG